MSTTLTAGLANATSNPLMEKAKLFRDHVQSIVTLATGALALSVTFLHDIATKHTAGWLIERAWYGLVATVVLGIFYSYVLLAYVKADGRSYGKLLGGLSVFLHAAFLGALVYLVRFAMANF
ncbi:MAG TPA: hypothetical protein VJP87_03785 [Candidatus Acidoferrales bacterium]|nr:hypothetical protein [Candidatus Acidoferrales bacterium]